MDLQQSLEYVECVTLKVRPRWKRLRVLPSLWSIYAHVGVPWQTRMRLMWWLLTVRPDNRALEIHV